MNIAPTLITVLLLGISGLLFGFASTSNNTTGNVKNGLLSGLLVGAIISGLLLLGGSGYLVAGVFLASTVVGSLISALTPNESSIKRYFNLNGDRSTLESTYRRSK